MYKNTVKVIVLTLCLVAAGFKAYAYDNGDFQIWHTENQDVKLNKISKLALEEEFRFGNNAGEFYYQHYDAGIIYDVNKNLSIGANYRQIWELNKGEFRPEYRPHINATVKWDLYGFQCEDRNRLEYRLFDYQDGIVRYRNKLTVKFPWKFTKLEVQPYVADEIFADINGAIMRRNRFYTGLWFNLTKEMKAEAYYLLQSSKSSGRWTDANVLGTRLKISF